MYLNISIPFKKEIQFKTSIAEICSISLEKDISINDNELLGDFIITGEYRNLDINVDTMPFEHIIPFKVDLDKDIIIETLDYDIGDFNYEIKNEDTLIVNIVLNVSAEKKKLDESIFIKDDDENRFNIVEEQIIDNVEEDKDSKSIINSELFNEDYVTYHIHIVKVNETIESISKDYKIEKDKLLELNDISQISIGDKLIIPDINES